MRPIAFLLLLVMMVLVASQTFTKMSSQMTGTMLPLQPPTEMTSQMYTHTRSNPEELLQLPLSSIVTSRPSYRPPLNTGLPSTVMTAPRLSFFSDDAFPGCVSGCENLYLHIETACEPRVYLGPFSELEFLMCLCSSGFLKTPTLLTSMCDQYCTEDDSKIIFEKYTESCRRFLASALAISHTPQTSPPFTSHVIAQSTYLVNPPPKTDSARRPDDSGAWLHRKWKFLVIGGVLIVVTFCAIVGLAFFYRKKKSSDKTKRYNGLIPLSVLKRYRRQSGESSKPLGTCSTSTLPQLPPSAHSTFPAHLRLYAQEVREAEERKKLREAEQKRRKALLEVDADEIQPAPCV